MLIIDVGGGSAEFIVGEAGELKEGISRPLGAVRLTEVFLKEDPPTPIALASSRNVHRRQVRSGPKAAIADLSFDRVIGTSATAAAIVSAINHSARQAGRGRPPACENAGYPQAVQPKLSRMDLGERKKTEGIGPRRAEIVVAGTAVFLRTLEA